MAGKHHGIHTHIVCRLLLFCRRMASHVGGTTCTRYQAAAIFGADRDERFSDTSFAGRLGRSLGALVE